MTAAESERRHLGSAAILSRPEKIDEVKMEQGDVWSRLETGEDWKRARRKALYQGVVCFLKQCSVDLLPFEEVRTRLHLSHRIDRGLQEIPLDRIRGSVGRYDDFTSAFLPRKDHLQERWERVDLAVMASKTPPIEVYQVGEAYFVLDGNHRVSIARQHGAKSIEAYVCEYPTPHGLGPDADIDELLLKSGRIEFLARVGQASPPAVRDIAFTCPACYDHLLDMIETYRQGLEKEAGCPVSFEETVSAWHQEVYGPAIDIIQRKELLARFPKRTEADLFLWAWENGQILEDLVLADESPPDGDQG